MKCNNRGYLGKYDLLDWFHGLSSDRQAGIRSAFQQMSSRSLSIGGSADSAGLDTGRFGTTDQKSQAFLGYLADYAVLIQDFATTEGCEAPVEYLERDNNRWVYIPVQDPEEPLAFDVVRSICAALDLPTDIFGLTLG